MATYAPRCPHCASSIDVPESFLSKIKFWTHKSTANCTACSRTVDLHQATVMGDAFGRWADHFSQDLRKTVDELPILKNVEARRVIGTKVHDEDVRLLSSFEALSSTVLRQARQVLRDKSHGEEVLLDAAVLRDPASPQEAIAVILGRSAVSSGQREWEALIARLGKSEYVAYFPPIATGVEQRVREAIRDKKWPGLASV